MKPEPEISTWSPSAPLLGLRPLMEEPEPATSVKFVALLAVPPGAVTLMGECAKPLGTTAVICVSESTVKLVAAMAPNVTFVAPVKPVPVTVTLLPTGPDVGLNAVIVGTGGGGGGVPERVKRARPDCGTPEIDVK